jgi:hypothetical protein
VVAVTVPAVAGINLAKPLIKLGVLLALVAGLGLAAVVVALAGLVGTLDSPGPASPDAIANVPAAMLALYQSAASVTCPGMPWQVLAAIGTVETDNDQSRVCRISGLFIIEPPWIRWRLLLGGLPGREGLAHKVQGLVLEGRGHPNGAVNPGRVVPVDPAGSGRLDVFDTGPAAAVKVDELAFVEADRGFHKSVVQCVTYSSDGRRYSCCRQRFGEADSGVLGELNRSLQHRLAAGMLGAR